MNLLVDQHARSMALTTFDRTLLLEAGAGSGKTAILAGRVALMLAAGINASEIVAITFTEAAASELLSRIRDYVAKLSAGELPLQLAAALPAGLSQAQSAALKAAEANLDDLTCTTIHGFCQRLIRPYPIETGMDPGANITDPIEADLLLQESIDDWLREHLGGESEGYLVELVRYNPKLAVRYTHELARTFCEYRAVEIPEDDIDGEALRSFLQAAHNCLNDIKTSIVSFPELEEVVAALSRIVRLARFDNPAALIELLTSGIDAVLKADGGFRRFQHKGRYEKAAASHGISKAQALEEMYAVQASYDKASEVWPTVRAASATLMLNGLMREARLAADRYHDLKRRSALLDFDDLLHAARDLLANYSTVRDALAERYKYVLVDEFQDTDPLQAEILWRLCGSEDIQDLNDWTQSVIRPGSLFLVGDPKQAIYRFRGADVATYVQARDSLAQADDEAIQSISVNFRSRSGLLSFVNTCFESPLGREGQPGFTPLDVGRVESSSGPAVSVLKLPGEEKMGAKAARELEATAVAQLCSSLIASHEVSDDEGGVRPVEPRDIALLAPTGTELYLYEAALENLNIPVASQAGKSFWLRQEVQDLVALTRALADSRDRLALLALLRGPLIGLTDEEILDIGWDLVQAGADEQPEPEIAPDATAVAGGTTGTPRLTIDTDPELIKHALASDTLRRLQALKRIAGRTTPYHLLSQAVDQLRVRPVLRQRHARPERVLANVSAFLELARPYDVRGLQAFASNVTASWSDAERALEGRADKDEDAVNLVTMHSAKGLEWPIVVAVNTVSVVGGSSDAFVDRANNRLHRKVLGAEPLGFAEALERETIQTTFERERLWYVATTRAREQLILPYVEIPGDKSTRWYNLVPLFGQGADEVSLEAYPEPPQVLEPTDGDGGALNLQTRIAFQEEAQRIEAARAQREWLTPSRSEAEPGFSEAEAGVEIQAREETEELQFVSEEVEALATPAPQGGRDRGTVMHKLFEEVLTGELDEDQQQVEARADELIRMLGLSPKSDAAEGLSAVELAESVLRSLALPDVVAVRHNLEPELPVFSIGVVGEVEHVTVGVADAIQWSDDGKALAVIDWKSDVNPSSQTVEKYKGQIRAYLRATGAERGLLVMATKGYCLRVDGSRTPN